MGLEIQISSLEDMCALMCDNVIPPLTEEESEEPEENDDEVVHSSIRDR